MIFDCLTGSFHDLAAADDGPSYSVAKWNVTNLTGVFTGNRARSDDCSGRSSPNQRSRKDRNFPRGTLTGCRRCTSGIGIQQAVVEGIVLIEMVLAKLTKLSTYRFSCFAQYECYRLNYGLSRVSAARDSTCIPQTIRDKQPLVFHIPFHKKQVVAFCKRRELQQGGPLALCGY